MPSLGARSRFGLTDLQKSKEGAIAPLSPGSTGPVYYSMNCCYPLPSAAYSWAPLNEVNQNWTPFFSVVSVCQSQNLRYVDSSSRHSFISYVPPDPIVELL